MMAWCANHGRYEDRTIPGCPVCRSSLLNAAGQPDHNDRPVSASEYRWLHAEVLRLAGRVAALEAKLAAERHSEEP